MPQTSKQVPVPMHFSQHHWHTVHTYISYIFTSVITDILLCFWLWLWVGSRVNKQCFTSFPVDLLLLLVFACLPCGCKPLLLCWVSLWVIIQSSTCTLCVCSSSFCFPHCILHSQQPPPLLLYLVPHVHSPALCLPSWHLPYSPCISSALASPHLSLLTFFSPVWVSRTERHSCLTCYAAGYQGKSAADIHSETWKGKTSAPAGKRKCYSVLLLRPTGSSHFAASHRVGGQTVQLQMYRLLQWGHLSTAFTPRVCAREILVAPVLTSWMTTMKSVGGDHRAIIEKSLSPQGTSIWGLTASLYLCMPTNCSSNDMFTLEFQLLGVHISFGSGILPGNEGRMV